MAVAKLKSDATEARLAGLTLPAGLDTARKDALSRLIATGLPHKRDEYWKYTDPASLTQADAPQAALFHNDEGPMFDAIDRVKIVFVDGVFVRPECRVLCRALCLARDDVGAVCGLWVCGECFVLREAWVVRGDDLGADHGAFGREFTAELG